MLNFIQTKTKMILNTGISLVLTGEKSLILCTVFVAGTDQSTNAFVLLDHVTNVVGKLHRKVTVRIICPFQTELKDAHLFLTKDMLQVGYVTPLKIWLLYIALQYDLQFFIIYCIFFSRLCIMHDWWLHMRL